VARLSASLLALALGAVAALSLAACGSSDSPELLPGSTASEITANLDEVKELATAGDCVGAEAAAQSVSTQIEDLGGVDKKLKQSLREGATRLNEVVAECEEVEPEESAETIEPAEEFEEEPKEKPDKQEKPAKEKKTPEKSESEAETTPPPAAEGKAKGHEKPEETETPPVEPSGGTAAGGVGPATPAEGE
jgi:outer membrane biosynthesis protein TonB